MLVTDVIAAALQHNTRDDLAALYTPHMEVQINVAQDDGKSEGRCYTDGKERWFNIRIPKKADIPAREGGSYFNDYPMPFHPRHIQAIGMTGWDWRTQCSRWVGFDFDSIVNHTEGLPESRLTAIREAVSEIDWLTVRKSTSGLAFHIYVPFEEPPHVETHTEHAALARAVLGVISLVTGESLECDVDCYGKILWVWSRRMDPDEGFKLIKPATRGFTEIPQNWKDHVTVIKGSARKCKAPGQRISDIIIATKSAELQSRHKALVSWFTEQKTEGGQPVYWWDSDRGCFVCHTHWLKKAHTELGLRGVFETVSQDEEWSNSTQNCFMFPQAEGWRVFRHTKGAKEHRTWSSSSKGWTMCLYDVPTDLPTAAMMYGAVAGRRGDWNFPTLKSAVKAIEEIGATCPMPAILVNRATTLNMEGDQLVVKTKKASAEPDFLEGWFAEKNKYERIIPVDVMRAGKQVLIAPDDKIRYLVSCGQVVGWFLHTPQGWLQLSKSDLLTYMKGQGIKTPIVTEMLSKCISEFWTLECFPFQDEYPGNRVWNRRGARLSQKAQEGKHLHWDMLFGHLGKGLNETVAQNKWLQSRDIKTGADYLKVWVALMIRRPRKSLPYLFLYSRKQHTGKSTFHEAISLLFAEGRGYARANAALRSSQGFNGELEGAVFCAVEEENLGTRGAREALNRIKDWVTSEQILIHPKGKTPYLATNYTHWVQTANDKTYCPIFPGDTRITMAQVEPLDYTIVDFKDQLRSETSAIIHTLMSMPLPEIPGRLGLPCLNTPEKLEAMEAAQDKAIIWLESRTHDAPGYTIALHDAYVDFLSWLEESYKSQREVKWWSKRRFSANLPDTTIRGKYQGVYHIANRSLDAPTPGLNPRPLVRRGINLVTIDEAREIDKRRLQDGNADM